VGWTPRAHQAGDETVAVYFGRDDEFDEFGDDGDDGEEERGGGFSAETFGRGREADERSRDDGEGGRRDDKRDETGDVSGRELRDAVGVSVGGIGIGVRSRQGEVSVGHAESHVRAW